MSSGLVNNVVAAIYRKLVIHGEAAGTAMRMPRIDTEYPPNTMTELSIAEGFGRDTHKDFAHFLSQARGSLYEVDTQVEIAIRRGFVEKDQKMVDLMNEISKMLASLSRRLRSPH